MSDVTLEIIARKFNCVDVDELTDLEADIVEVLVEEGYLDQDTVETEDGDFLYSELHYVDLKTKDN